MTNVEIKLVRGLPASGKSTWAKQWVDENEDWRIRINRDDIRHQIVNKYWPLSRMQEDHTTLMEEAMVTAAIKAKVSVVIDATHLRASYVKRWYDVANRLGVSVSVQDFETDVDECVRRDAIRGQQGDRFVGEEVIRDLHKRFFVKGKLPKLPENTVAELSGRAYVRNRELPKAVWVDVDGTLAERVHPLANVPVRGPFDEDRVEEDAVIDHIADLVRLLHANGYKIVIMSGRSDACQERTERWLIENNIPYDDIFMRPFGDTRKDSVIKEELFWTHVAPKYDIEFALDDRQQVVDHTREVLNIPVLQVAPGNF
ncbi:polynucleotide kinase [Arthrobacter phage Racecar]|nr:polynucleotide kinase [Arthrobacter phage Racecar]